VCFEFLGEARAQGHVVGLEACSRLATHNVPDVDHDHHCMAELGARGLKPVFEVQEVLGCLRRGRLSNRALESYPSWQCMPSAIQAAAVESLQICLEDYF
jgi:hypothetical protein